ncbi:MAG: hypothetical protein NVSMB68_07470 [Thermoanaerobaculia bacterium]
MFGTPVIGVSLLSFCAMHFRMSRDPKTKHIQLLEPRSLYILDDASRTQAAQHPPHERAAVLDHDAYTERTMNMSCHSEPRRRRRIPCRKARTSPLAGAFLATLLLLTGCDEKRVEHAPGQAATAAGNPDRGRQLITQYGCPSCHTIPGIKGPKGVVGPPLDGIGARPFIAGKVQNTPANLTSWLQNPQAFDPGNAMPNLGVTPGDARDITAYLDNLK